MTDVMCQQKENLNYLPSSEELNYCLYRACADYLQKAIMRLRIRRGKSTTILPLDSSNIDAFTFGDLKHKLIEHLEIETSVDELNVSLDGKTPITDDKSSSLTNLGIVSGDLLHILLPSGEDNIADSEKCGSFQPSREVQNQGSSINNVEVRDKEEYNDTCMTESSCSQQEVKAEKCSEENDLLEIPDEEDVVRDSEVNRFLNEPLLVQECQQGMLTALLKQTYIDTRPTSCAEAICVVLHTLMVESGLTANPANTTPSQLPYDWRKSSTFRMNYRHSVEGAAHIRLICVTLGKNVIIHGSVVNHENGEEKSTCQYHQLQLKPEDYVKTVTESPTQVYKNLPLLSRLFRDAISFRLLQSIHMENQPLVSSLQTLPMEIKLSIMRYLDACTLARLCQVSTVMRDIASEPAIWRRLYLIQFGRRTEANSLDMNWKSIYKEKYVWRQRLPEQMRHRILPQPFPHLQTPHPPSPSVPVYPPGFVGGDYDLNPDFGIADPFGRHGQRALIPPRPRIDPYGPLPSQQFRPGRGGGMWDAGGSGQRPRRLGGFMNFF